METRIEEARERKMDKYASLKQECEQNGWGAEVHTVEVGCRGFAGVSVRRWIRAMGFSGREGEKWVRRMCGAAERGSAWVIQKAS